MLFTAGESDCVFDHVTPPLVERAKTVGSGSAFGLLDVPARNEALQRYALPKNGLVAALSAQTCSLSEKRAAFCFVTITGADQPAFDPAIAAARSTVYETVAASKPLNA